MDVPLKSNLTFSECAFGAPLAASYVEDISDRNQVVATVDDGS
jgi:hypothetical protein